MQTYSETFIIGEFKDCIKDALSKYKSYKASKTSFLNYAVPTTGVTQAELLLQKLERIQNMESLRLTMIGHMKSHKSDFTANSFISYVLNALKYKQFLIEALNNYWFNKRYYHVPLLLPSSSPNAQITGRANLKLSSQVDYTDKSETAQEQRTIGIAFFKEVLCQPEQDNMLIALKDLMYKAYHAYENWHKLFPEISKNDDHGPAGISRAMTFRDSVSKACTFEHALSAFVVFFQSGLFTSKPRHMTHSFISYLLNALRDKPDLLDTINTLWFFNSPIILTASNYCDDDTHTVDSRKKIFDRFVGLQTLQDSASMKK
ncbi:MAG: hypothetical protein AB7F64_05700 [Gammaproteobacteria bacterium]